MTLLLQISDPHFGTEQPLVVAALLRLANTLQPDLVVMSGDITQRARRAQFSAARAFVDTLGKTPLVIVPGNHDIPLYNLFARIAHPYANYQRVFGDDLDPVFESAELMVIGVNTTRAYRRKDGEISAQQVERVVCRLDHATPRQLRVVVTHQPVVAARANDIRNLLHGREHALERWSQAGVDLILGGHIHLPYVSPLHVAYKDLPRRMWAVQAGTSLSSRVRGKVPNSVNVIDYDGSTKGARRVVVTRWDFNRVIASFEPDMQHQLDLDNESLMTPLATLL
ncbi:MAG: repair exonuclease [Caballeronia sp.]|jgi:3',5'-cyclic AMP phosphodiesterase CpdA|uniref:metallophosphoesterase family protein n=1 Tax=Caballeronia sp. TaxID=1931223 RepID=UPI00260CD488|nr:metallophosphoesterase family protein [Caballeronia sp.]MDB5833225.1 repair exonuclease [Caballeronia sp.]